MTNYSSVISGTINGVSGQKDIADIRCDHFKTLLNSNQNEKYKAKLIDGLSLLSCDKYELSSMNEVQYAINKENMV